MASNAAINRRVHAAWFGWLKTRRGEDSPVGVFARYWVGRFPKGPGSDVRTLSTVDRLLREGGREDLVGQEGPRDLAWREFSQKTKRCFYCHEHKLRTMFGVHSGQPDGLQQACRECRKQITAIRPRYPRSLEPKQCAACDQTLPAAEFTANPNSRTGLASKCRRCKKHKDRARNLRLNFGLSEADYDRLFVFQQGLCGICQNPERKAKTRLAVDHNHQDNSIRGLACTKHNKALGVFGDNVPGLLRALEYLVNMPAQQALGFGEHPEYLEARAGKVQLIRDLLARLEG